MSEEKCRCPSCRGSKQVPKLGGMYGDCNTCQGTGQILVKDMPVAVVHAVITPAKLVINAVAECLPATTIDDDIVLPANVDSQIKVDAKKALYKRKLKSFDNKELSNGSMG